MKQVQFPWISNTQKFPARSLSIFAAFNVLWKKRSPHTSYRDSEGAGGLNFQRRNQYGCQWMDVFALPETNIAMENGPFEDVLSIKNSDIPLLCSFTRVYFFPEEWDKKLMIYHFLPGKTCRSSYWTMRFLSVFSEDYTFSEDYVSMRFLMVLFCFPPVSDMFLDHLGSLDGAWVSWIAHWAFQLSIETLHWAGSTLHLSFWSFTKWQNRPNLMDSFLKFDDPPQKP